MVTVAVNFTCNNNCIFCSVNSNKEQKNRHLLPDKNEIFQILDMYADQNETVLKLTGGEPTLRKDLPEIISYAKKIGFKKIIIDSNGWRLADKDYIKLLSKTGANSFRITFLGACPETHDSIAGRKKSFVKAIEGIKNACALKKTKSIFVVVDYVILKKNLKEIPLLASFFGSLPIDLLAMVYVKPLGKAKPAFEKIAPSLTEVKKGLGKLKPSTETVLQEIPFCALSELKSPFVVSKHSYSDFIFQGINELQKKNMSGWVSENCIKPKICKTCAHFDDCPGLWPDYLKKYGLNEIKPLKKRLKIYREN